MTAKPADPGPPRENQDEPQGGVETPNKTKKELDRELDKALQDSFPASDPPAGPQPTKPEPAGDPQVEP